MFQRAGLRVVRRGRLFVESDGGLAARLEVRRGAVVVDAPPGESVVQQVGDSLGVLTVRLCGYERYCFWVINLEAHAACALSRRATQ